MHLLLKLLAYILPAFACFGTLQAVQVLPPAGGFKTPYERDEFMFYQNYNYQNEQQELMRQQVQIQRDMLHAQRQQQRGW